MSHNDRHGSHLPLLIKALGRTGSKPVLELGLGYNSTPVLHWLCADRGRYLVSHETDEKWASHFSDYASDWHAITVTDREPMVDHTCTKGRGRWGVVLIDGRPARHRHHYALQLKDRADIIIIHDTEPEIDRFYKYSRIYKHFKYRLDDTRFMPHTTALSNFIDVAKELV